MPANGSPVLNMLRVHDQPVAYLDEGIGTPVLLAHCSSASHKEWTALVKLLRPRHRVLAPDLMGYGKSARWPAGKRLDFETDVRVIDSLAHLADERLHLAGHSYGAAIALEAARVLGRRVKSLTLVEPASFHLLHGPERETEWREVERVALRASAAAERGQMKEAAGIFMTFWSGRLRWWLMPAKAKASVISTMTKVCEEFAMLSRAPSRTDGYKLISAPVRLIVGQNTKAPARAVTEVLSGALPRVHVKQIKGAGHMSPFTHTKQVNRLIAEHIEACEAE
jgi:pimeloyl-ACP methyl ester carboxylesterase